MNARYEKFRKTLASRLMVLDGSMGALLQRRNLPPGYAPDLWNLENPSAIKQVHQEYFDAGADILITNTFGASRLRLQEYGAYGKLREINRAAVEIARSVVGDKGFVAGDIGPCGDTIFPTGNLPFETAVEIFREQADALISAGADLLIVETMFDSLDYKAALSGIRAVSQDVPVIALMTFNTDGISDTGISPESCVAIAEGFHVDVVGANCSVGPDAMIQVISRMKKVSQIPVCAQPNAGMPKLQNGTTVFPLDAEKMGGYAESFFNAGARVLGGCCGTTPEYIKILAQIRDSKGRELFSATEIKPRNRVILSSKQKIVTLGPDEPFVMIGEKINPTGRKKVAENIRAGNIEALMADAAAQVEAGAHVLDVNVGVPLIDEPAMMANTITAIQNAIEQPLCIDSSFSKALLTGASCYYGRPLLNSLNAEDEKMDEVIPIAQKTGAAVLALTTETEVPETAAGRMKYAQKILDRMLKAGFKRNDIVFDVLALTASAMKKGSIETFSAIEMITRELGCATTFGLSNSSFGLPNRRFVHQTYLMIAMQRGLSSAIMNVLERDITVRVAAADLFRNRARSTEDFLENFSKPIEEGAAGQAATTSSANDAETDPTAEMKLDALSREIYFDVLDGKKDKIITDLNLFIQTRSKESFGLFLNVMTPAIRYLGDLFGKRKRFIPHLVAAAEAMKAGVEVLQPYLKVESKDGTPQKRGTVIFATVKGDIHDIGKNICILMLRNFGFEVIDLGRNVSMEEIFDAARKHKAQIIALSALMTTTMIQMKLLIEENRKQGYGFKVLVGGAPVTDEFAKEIGADGHSEDVGSIVGETERVLEALGYRAVQ
ncbi:MAG: homocysteine S-methyltransferase family protein [Bdellovibrionales bacterium]|nr:homocysteine S-methyltransferase family protein [Bdellovibrionales bacterium]